MDSFSTVVFKIIHKKQCEKNTELLHVKNKNRRKKHVSSGTPGVYVLVQYIIYILSRSLDSIYCKQLNRKINKHQHQYYQVYIYWYTRVLHHTIEIKNLQVHKYCTLVYTVYIYCHRQHTFTIQQNVFRLKVAVHDIQAMHVLES